jgi:hypothetical protein
MGLNNVFAAILGATLVASSGMSVADEYRPGEFFGLDLSKAVLSPKPLGPATQFAPVEIEARAERASPAAPARAARVAPARTNIAKTDAKRDAAKTDVARKRADRPRSATSTKLARPRGNPLDAQAFDTRIQTWPCMSGGICNWK